jgi:hypothetical protein
MAKLTECAATAYEATEQNIVNSFDEFLVRPGQVRAVASEPVELATVVDGTGNGLDPSETVEGWPPAAVEQLVEQSQGEIDEITERFNQIQEALGTTEPEPEGAEDVVVTATEDSAVEDADSSEGRAKAGVRMPWSRFMTKAVHESKVREVKFEGKTRERRFKTSDPAVRPGSRLCRLCFTVVAIEPEYIETTDMHVYLCCPNCGQSFPIRHSDSEALSTPQTPIS